MSKDWDMAAAGWIAAMGEQGDWARREVTDPALKRILTGYGGRKAVDVGCGEGRLCRMMRGWSIDSIGIDPTRTLIEEARRRDPAGCYVQAGAQALPLRNESVDLSISCLSLIDIEDIDRAVLEMVRVLKPHGRLIVVNLTSFNTAGGELGWHKDGGGKKLFFRMDRYLDERDYEIAFSGIRVINRHRPLSRYMALFLEQGLILERFEEPEPITQDDPTARDYRRAPWFHVMVWRKQEA